ncbi:MULTISPECIES: NAD(P)H-dependent oxidoreductase subunit E [unclassified Thermosipho (in: thermotogales)]|uniref:NAD(P)H-dependent oxidoreductase subunit E n=1 Tax=unclassified Thermosipho (in: thermotogales) TaxID=2676525 RepID=UPI0009866028|nr:MULTISPECIES: NAD(P)H-dependent oxidoreductase subunit E [unclassified Thermosipho (in: thermotogales)]MBT1247160.1 hypothetical protein [Thermosipho sp. 1244]OOC47087.1 hypothetical protein XO09_03190 [Thermosipho sp. 1223]
MDNPKKVDVEVCVGTTCHLMGSSILIDTIENLPEEVKEHLNFKCSLCFGDCNEGRTPPIIKVNKITYHGVTPEKLKEIIFSCLEEIK